MNEKMKRIKETVATKHEEKMPDGTKNALRYTTSAIVYRYIKIGCAWVFDTVAAYALFKITKPLFF